MTTACQNSSSSCCLLCFETTTIKVDRWVSHDRACVVGLGSQDEVKLVEKIFDGYNALIRPVQNLTTKVKVDVQLALIQIIDVVRVLPVLTASCTVNDGAVVHCMCYRCSTQIRYLFRQGNLRSLTRTRTTADPLTKFIRRSCRPFVTPHMPVYDDDWWWQLHVVLWIWHSEHPSNSCGSHSRVMSVGVPDKLGVWPLRLL